MSALRFTARLEARYLRVGAPGRSTLFAMRILRLRSMAVPEAKVYLRARRFVAAGAPTAGAPGATFHLASLTREVLREIHHHEGRAVLLTRPAAAGTAVAVGARVELAPLLTARAASPPSRHLVFLQPAPPTPALRANVVVGPGAPVLRAPGAPAGRAAPASRGVMTSPARVEGSLPRRQASLRVLDRLQRVSSSFTLVDRTTMLTRTTVSAPGRATPVEMRAPPAVSTAVFTTVHTASTSPRPPASAPVVTPIPRAQPGPGAFGRALQPARRAEGPPPTRPLLRVGELRQIQYLRSGSREGAAPRIEPRRGMSSGVTVLQSVEASAPTRPLGSSPDRALALRRPSPPGPPALGLEYLRPRPAAAAAPRLEETLRRHVEEHVDQRITTRVETVVARELAPDSAYSRRLGERIHAGIHDGLVLERERMGWR